MSDKIIKFEDMQVWKDSQDLAVLIYKVTKDFPKEEMYGLTSQIRRAASSVSANIAEGFGRSTYRDRSNFYHIARGSLNETKNFILLAERLEIMRQDDVVQTIRLVDAVNRQINAILKHLHHHD